MTEKITREEIQKHLDDYHESPLARPGTAYGPHGLQGSKIIVQLLNEVVAWQTVHLAWKADAIREYVDDGIDEAVRIAESWG